eukprot:4921182-Pyramimonas_sp.AAC.1
MDDEDGPGEMQQQFEQNLGEVADSGTALTVGLFKQILNEKLKPIEKDIDAIKKHGVSHQDLQDAVQPLKAAVDDITSRASALEVSTPKAMSARSESEASLGT